MRVGVIGSGDVGRVLAKGFASRGHDVVIGSRDPSKLEDIARETEGLRAGTFRDAAAHGEIIVLATAFDGAENAIDLAGRENFAGKIVIDTTNPVKFEEGRMPSLSIGFDTSAGEHVQTWIPNAKVVKAYNTIGNGLMIDPAVEGGPPVMFICGNDVNAKKTVAGIIESFGYPGSVADLGGIEEARYLEPLAMVWIHYGIKHQSWLHAFKLLQ